MLYRKDRHQPTRPQSSLPSAIPGRLLLGLGCVLALLAPSAHAAQGLSVPEADQLWPQWQVRVSLAASSSVGDGASARRSWYGILSSHPQRAALGAAVLGDLTLASPSFGNFRASGGLLVGGYRALPSAGANVLPLSAKLSLATPSYNQTYGHNLLADTSGLGLAAAGAATTDVLPYLGIGFSSALWRDSLAVSADMGWVSERPSAAGAAGRALFGNQGFDGAVREMRLSPVLQLSLRYRF